jgi:hypothetical protein
MDIALEGAGERRPTPKQLFQILVGLARASHGVHVRERYFSGAFRGCETMKTKVEAMR